MRYTPVDAQSLDQVEGLDDWQYRDDALLARFHLGSFTAAGAFAAEIARFADEMDHHPDIDLRYPDVVSVKTFTHVTGGITTHDVQLARHISSVAQQRRT